MQVRRQAVKITDIKEKWLGLPGIEVTPAGRVLVVWYTGGEREPHAENTIYLSISDDGGQSFGPPEMVAGPEIGFRTFDPTLWFDPRGRLWLIYNRGNKDAGEHYVYYRLCTEPDAPCLQWGPEQRVELGVPYAFRINKPIVLANGEWLMPVTWAESTIYDWHCRCNLQGVALSADQGETWRLYGRVQAPEWALENMVIERRDGSLLMYLRSGENTIWQSNSTDGGRTWSPGESSGIDNPKSRFHLRRLASGKWLLIKNLSPSERTGMAVYVSADEGGTWRQAALLDERTKVSYPDATQTGDGAIWAVHDRDRNGEAEIILARFSEDDLA